MNIAGMVNSNNNLEEIPDEVHSILVFIHLLILSLGSVFVRARGTSIAGIVEEHLRSG